MVIERNPDGTVSAWVPSLPGCASQGETVEEALRNVAEAVELYLEVLRENGDPIPTEELAQVEVEI